MKPLSPLRIRQFLFLKIAFIFLFAVTTVSALLLWIDDLEVKRAAIPALASIMVHHAQGIVADFGPRPTAQQLQKVADSLQVEIRYVKDGVTWQSNPDMQVLDPAAMKPYAGDDRIRVAIGEKIGGIFVNFVHLDTDNGNYQLNLLDVDLDEQDEIYDLASLVVVLFSFLAIYFIIRTQLKPIKALQEGVREIGEGNLDFEIDINKVDELGQLAHSFNHMTKQVRELILARDQLLLDVSHELRSPLTRMLIAIEFLQDNNIKQTLYRNIKSMEAMVSEILESERLNSPHGGLQFERLNIVDLLTDACENFQDQKPGVILKCSFDDLILTIDPGRVVTVLNNLLSNAIKHSNATAPIEVSCTRGPGKVLVKVQDNGTGIPQEDLAYIFEPFYRVDKSRSKRTGGYGLGMSVCKKIMEAHNGRIEISSHPNKGTSVLLTFPCP